MNIQILKSTIVNGKSVEAGEELEVSDKEGRALCASKKAINLDETVELEVTVDVKNTEAFEELKNKFEEVVEANATLITERDDLSIRLDEITKDVHTLTLKDLKEKYPKQEESD